jgi:hypothetical protein
MQTNVKVLSRPVVSLMLLDAYSGMMLALVATTSPFVAATFALPPAVWHCCSQRLAAAACWPCSGRTSSIASDASAYC